MRLTSSKSERWIEAVVAQVHVLQARSGQAESYGIAIGFGPRQQLERRSFLIYEDCAVQSAAMPSRLLSQFFHLPSQRPFKTNSCSSQHPPDSG